MLAFTIVVFALGQALLAAADMNGMDMSMDGPMDLAVGQMLPYLHFTIGDNLFFLGWVPQTTGAMVGVCIALFLLAIIERWVAACRSLMEVHWSRRSKALVETKRLQTTHDKDSKSEKGAEAIIPTLSSPIFVLNRRNIAPFVPSHDITRGIVFAGQAILGYTFMLAIMTFQAGFILSIALGLGFGEMLFGRYHAHAHL